MSNYKWVQESTQHIGLRSENFLISTGFFSVPSASMNPLLKQELDDNGIDWYNNGESYELTAIDKRFVKITAPLYQLNIHTNNFDLLQNAYTDYTIDPLQREWVKEIYLSCVKKVAIDQAKVFEEKFKENSLDEGISSVVTISLDSDKEPYHFYQQYVPKNYIKVCEKNCPWAYYRHEVVFIKKMDAKGQAVTIKVNDLYKGLVIGKSGENIKKIAKMINARRINVI